MFVTPHVHYTNYLNVENKIEITSVYNRLSGSIFRAGAKQGSIGQNHSPLEELPLKKAQTLAIIRHQTTPPPPIYKAVALMAGFQVMESIIFD